FPFAAEFRGFQLFDLMEESVTQGGIRVARSCLSEGWRVEVMKASSLRCAFLLVTMVALPAHGTIIIDDFSTFQSVSQNCATIGTPVGTTVLGGGILGGERDVRLNITACPGVGDLQVLVTSYFHSADA
ncbi:MAG: hypothetical protein AAB214_07385, partial [Fibrobacterota bacterium]